MANLVMPPAPLEPIEERIIEFKGLNRRSVIEEGEMPEMWNLSPDNYPTLSPRKPRAIFSAPEGVKRPIHITSRYGRMGLIAIDEEDNVAFYFDNQKIDAVDDLTTVSWAVAINTKICFFPQKTYLELTQSARGIAIGEYASLEASQTATNLTVNLTNETGKITLPAGHGFAYDDAIAFEGSLTYTSSGGVASSAEFKTSAAIDEVINSNTLVFPSEVFTAATGVGASNVKYSGTIKRTVPELDMVIEWNNRLWGVNNYDNTIYACKLGDPKNWQYYQGTSLDSYYAQQGTDEKFTGIAEYSGHIIFFKPNSMCRVYGTAPSNYQVTNAKCYGVEEGSSKSVLTINDTVFYKSSIGIMAYTGGIPTCVSEKIGNKFKNVVAGTEGRKYYAAALELNSESYRGALFVLDIDRLLWHQEDNLRFTDTCTFDNQLFYTTTTADVLVCDLDVFCAKDLMCGSDFVEGYAGIINPSEPTESEDDIEWRAVFGPFDEYIEEHKIYSKLALRFRAKGPASADVFISIDEGPWELVQKYESVSTQGEFIPIVPRRSDRYSIKLEGKGNIEIKSLTRRVRRGTFGRL